MKKLIYTLIFTVFCIIPSSAQEIIRVEPLSWWVGMRMPLTIMFYGHDLCDCDVSVQEGGLTVSRVRNAESPNYLFVDVSISSDAPAGEYTFLLSKGRKKLKYKYKLENRREGSAGRKSFSSADVIYLLMPDRFANGDPTNDSTNDTAEKADRANPSGRHGGDLQGIINHLDYISDLGATAIWSTPLLLDNEPKVSYHGYACGDYYHIDPRYGNNELYRTFVAESHKRGLKVIMDIVMNHCGISHWWMSDLPYSDWIHQFDYYTQTNHVLSANMDPNASMYDLKIQESGWFDTSMPDMNLDNPDLLQYFKQWAVWWIEYADLDGLRVDTYPYNEKRPMSEWCKAIRAEYPEMNIVGECWTLSPSQLAYWDGGTKNKDGFSSFLPSVMDFPLQNAICEALSKDDVAWNEGLPLIYRSVSHDFLFDDPHRLLIMAANHDTERITDIIGRNPEKAKLVATLLATLRGVPQIFSGDELLFVSKDRSLGHSGLRVDFPGGWQDDPVNLFDPAQRTAQQQDVFEYYRALFNWRKGEPVIHSGKTMHFASHDNTYSYIRYNEECAVFVFVNASREARMIDWDKYREVLQSYHPAGKDVFTGGIISGDTNNVSVEGLASLVVKFNLSE